jgi:hypothetical protein
MPDAFGCPGYQDFHRMLRQFVGQVLGLAAQEPGKSKFMGLSC